MKILFLLLLAFSLTQSYAQGQLVQGTITDEPGNFQINIGTQPSPVLLPGVVAARDPVENAAPAGSQKYLAPIPISEFSPNPTWVQNAGY